jgi:hypothetical protein
MLLPSIIVGISQRSLSTKYHGCCIKIIQHGPDLVSLPQNLKSSVCLDKETVVSGHQRQLVIASHVIVLEKRAQQFVCVHFLANLNKTNMSKGRIAEATIHILGISIEKKNQKKAKKTKQNKTKINSRAICE